MALVSPRRVSASRSSSISFSLLLSGLILCVLPHLEALEEGDPCTLKGNLAGVCLGSSKCVPRINKYIETKRLTPSDIPTCGLSTREEIVCCPVAECCGDDQSPSSSSVNELPTRKSDNAEHAWNNVGPPSSGELTTSGRSTPNTDNSNIWKPKLDPDSPYFDFNQMMSGKQNPQTLPGNKADGTINENVAGGGSHLLISHMGAESLPFPTRDPRPIQSASTPAAHNHIHYPHQWPAPSREPRIINKPFSIEYPRRIMPWPNPSHSNTATDQQPTWQPLPEYPVPFNGVQVPQSNGNNEWNWFVAAAF
ncbi:uncharacterized protein Dmoj_GI15591, isoform D [Drosophila mojavensis]|uniref:Uncharacterized protein, isoform D n=1 Tax=Drosophila mojavensis TaxID=7230 RepID=A0A0Q9WMH7_DROMO|nr:uncharacterized protein Dmoj_GI15591, isoform D [Drosophila mojavensis]